MAFSPSTIDQFKSAVGKGNGFARANLYSVLLPSFGSGADTARNLSLFCSSVSLPARQLSTVERTIGVDTQKVAYGYVNDDVSMTFRVLNDQATREYFENWQKTVLGLGEQDGEAVVNYADDYCFPVHIYQLRKGTSLPVLDRDFNVGLGPINVNLNVDLDIGTSGLATYHWILERAYPVSIQNETLSDASQNTVSEITVQFAYKKWKGEKMTSKGLGDTTAGKILRVLNNRTINLP